jgi:hypothetical protein
MKTMNKIILILTLSFLSFFGYSQLDNNDELHRYKLSNY